MANVTPEDEANFRAILNDRLPRKRAIAQMLMHDSERRVLMCQLTYKSDWDLPGGVLEVGESPKLGVEREVLEELQLAVPVVRLLVADWLPPWGGWDDAMCLVFDGGEHDPSIVERIVKQSHEIKHVEFCTLEQIDERAKDFTARRIRAALTALDSEGASYTESGR